MCDCTSQSENMLKLMQWPLAKLGAESLDQVNSRSIFFFLVFSLDQMAIMADIRYEDNDDQD